MSDKLAVPEAVTDDALPSDPAVNALIQKLFGQLERVVGGMSQMSESLGAIRSDVNSMRSDITIMRVNIASIKGDVNSLQGAVDGLSERADRQDKRLAAIETFPPIPMSQPPRYLATEAHSVSLAERVRLSHLG